MKRPVNQLAPADLPVPPARAFRPIQLQNPAGARIRSTQGEASGAAPETGQSPVGAAPTHSRARRDAQVRELAPGTIRTLVIELTPARAAALDVFEITRGVKIADMLVDLMDDLIFEIRGGGKS